MKLRYYKSLLEAHLNEFQPCLAIPHFLFVFLFISTPELLRPTAHVPIHTFQVTRAIVVQSYSDARLCTTNIHVALGAESKRGLLWPHALNSFGQANWMGALNNPGESRKGEVFSQAQARNEMHIPHKDSACVGHEKGQRYALLPCSHWNLPSFNSIRLCFEPHSDYRERRLRGKTTHQVLGSTVTPSAVQDTDLFIDHIVPYMCHGS